MTLRTAGYLAVQLEDPGVLCQSQEWLSCVMPVGAAVAASVSVLESASMCG